MSRSTASATTAANWLWIAGPARRERGLIAAHSADRWIPSLQYHLREVEQQPVESFAKGLPFPDAHFDCVLLPGVVGAWEGFAQGTSARAMCAAAILECRRVLRSGGVLLVSGRNPLWYPSPSLPDFALRRTLNRAGFTSIREYFAEPSDSDPQTMIPACRSAAVAYERQERPTRGRAPRLLARLGLHAAAYPATVVLAFA